MNKKTGHMFHILIVFVLVITIFMPANLHLTHAETSDEISPLKGVPGKIELSADENIASWQRLQYGMFIHWGLYSELGGVWNGEPVTRGYSEQIQMWADIPEEDYLEVAERFSADKFDPEAICSLAKEAGMKYIVITSKHHDGFAMFDTASTDYDIVDRTPYGKDPLKQLADACRSQGLKFGVYFSLVDWHEGHAFDYNNNNLIPEEMEPIIEEQLRELMTNYGPIAEVWFDMSSPTQAQSSKFASIVRELQPQAVINSRIFNNVGDFRTLGDNQVPATTLDGAWQTPASIYHSTWGYRSWQVRDDFPGKVRDLVEGLTSVRARGGNYLLNIGPRGDGSVVEFEADVLRAIGEWLDRHPDAVLGASATLFGGQPWGEVTLNDNNLFLHVMNWPEDGELILPGLATDVDRVVEDGASEELNWRHEGNDLVVTLPETPMDDVLPVIRVELTGELRIIPERTIAAETDGTWSITPEDKYLGRSYADSGSYYSQVQTTVRQTAYLSTQRDGRVFLDLQGDADPESRYRVQLGTDAFIVTGEQLNESVVGPFIVPAGEVVPLTITRAEPAHAGEDLNLRFHSASLFTITNSADMRTMVDHYEATGELTDDRAARTLRNHLTAVNLYENKHLMEKAVKHMNNFNLLLDHQKDQALITEKVYHILKENTDYLLGKWQ